jgi:hypothetical protein
MPLQAPNLDDRTFEQLVADARARISTTAPEWTDLSPGDPGMTLVELFAYLAEAMIYRLNRVPDKLYVEFLRLIGVRLAPPAAAAVTLRFSRDPKAPPGDIEIPRNTLVTTATQGTGSQPPVFATTVHAVLPAGQESVDVMALNAELLEAEPAGKANGRAGQWFNLARPPAIAPTGDPLDLLVAVEAQPDEVPEGNAAVQLLDKTYRVWTEVENFSDLALDAPVYIADRAAGIITFAPAARLDVTGPGAAAGPVALAAVPGEGREIRFSYRRGGGTAGNVAAGTLTAMRKPIAGLVVTNPQAATGGREPETVENALIRGPQELRSLARAVTARDYQLVAERSSGAVARARAFTQAALWRYATPGTVEIVIVPALPQEGGEAGVSAEQLESLQTDDARAAVVRAIDERRPLGTSAIVNWARYKSVRIKATVVVRREEDLGGVRDRVNERLRLTVNPLPTDLSVGGWPFGQSLFASAVYKIVLSEPGVRYARGICLVVDSVPNVDVETVAADFFQPRTWYAGSGPRLFRTLNDGEGWEQMTEFEGVQITAIQANRAVPGLVAAVATLEEGKGSRLYVSRDSGATWEFTRPYGFLIEDIAWSSLEAQPLVLMATSGGLYQQTIGADADIVQLLVDSNNQDMPFYSVVATQEVKGEITVVVAAESSGGIYLSSQAGASGTFRQIGLTGEDVRVLAVQYDGPRSYLWAATAALGGQQTGKGAFRRELLGAEDPTQGWVAYGSGWDAGSCWSLAFAGSLVLAATQAAGVLRLDVNDPTPAWKQPDVNSGLPLRDKSRFLAIRSVAVDPEARLAMAGGPEGVTRLVDWHALMHPGDQETEPRYERSSESEFSEEVTLPPTWLFVCGENDIEVLTDAPN